MKIVGLKFKNINALQGAWEIRFDQPPLADAGLFAIVGPNGSGKTSILDAMTLGLYGETSRLKDPEQVFLNQDEDESSAEVTFSIGGSLYRSQWSMRRKAGKLESPQMMLTSLNGEEKILEDRVTRVRTLIADLTGLDFKRFCRSVLIAQGDFTAFLHSLENERSEILERIIGPELTRELEESIHAQIEEANESLLHLKETVAGAPLLTKEQVDALRETCEQTEEGLGETDRLLQELKAREEWLNRVALLERQEKEASERLAEVQAAADQLQTSLHQLEEAGKARPYQEDIAHLDELRKETARLVSIREQLEMDIELHQNQLTELEQQLQNDDEALEKAKSQLEGRGPDIQKALEMDDGIAQESNRFLELVSQYETTEHRLKELQQQQSDVEKQVAEAQIRYQELQQWLEDNPQDGRLESDIPPIEETLTRLKETRRQLEQQQSLWAEASGAEKRTSRLLKRADRAVGKVQNQAERLSSRKDERERNLKEILAGDSIESLTTRRRLRKSQLTACRKLTKIAKYYQKRASGEDPSGELTRVMTQHETVAESLTTEQRHLEELEASALRIDAAGRYASDRLLLKDGEPCPLCGALDHPFAEQGEPEPMEPDSLQDQRQKVKALQDELEAFKIKADELKAKVEKLQPTMDAWAGACARADVQWDVRDLGFVRQETRARRTELRILKSKIRAFRWGRWAQAWVSRAHRRKSDKFIIKEQEADKLRSAHNLELRALADVEARLDSLRDIEQTQKDELEERLATWGELLPPVGVETELLRKLRQRMAVYHNQQRERDSLSDQLGSLVAQKMLLPQELSDLKKKSESLAAEVEAGQDRLSRLKEEKEELFGALDPIQEGHDIEYQIALGAKEQLSLNQEIQSIRQTLSERLASFKLIPEEAMESQAAADQAQQAILERVKTEGFASLEEVRPYIRLLEQEKTTMEQWNTNERERAEAKTRHEVARTALESARSEHAVAEPLEVVTDAISQATRRRQFLRDELEAAQFALQQHRQTEREYRDVLQAVDEQEKTCGHLVNQQRALRSENPAEIRQKLQRLMLERLLDKTNKRLETLNGRYHLRPLSEEGLGFHIEDDLQNGAYRSPKTLSGGESFLVSLCLALGLADLASKDRKIESLFLDEGFGALDEEVLYRVIVTLKELHANGRTVGVISHVKRLADEIPTQIRVEKQPGGRSRISVVA